MLYIHIGTLKSGTSSIQKFMRTNCARLIEMGYEPRLRMLINMGLMRFVTALRGPEGKQVSEIFAEEISYACQNQKNVVVSNELFSFLDVPDVLMPPPS